MLIYFAWRSLKIQGIHRKINKHTKKLINKKKPANDFLNLPSPQCIKPYYLSKPGCGFSLVCDRCRFQMVPFEAV